MARWSNETRLLALATMALGAFFAVLGFGIPGRGEFAVVLWLVGFLGLLVAPEPRSWARALGIAGAVVAALMVLGAVSGGLLALVVAIVAALLFHGALVAAALRRAVRLGFPRCLLDLRVVAGLALGVALGVIFLQIAIGFAESPP